MGQLFDSIIKGFFWHVYNGNLEAWGERNNSLYLTNRKLAEFVDGEVNFISILADCSSTARADYFFNLIVHLCDDRNNRKMPTCCFSGVWLISDQQSVDLKSSLLKKDYFRPVAKISLFSVT